MSRQLEKLQAEVRDLKLQLADLRDFVMKNQARTSLRPDLHAKASALVPIIFSRQGNELFSGRELVAYAALGEGEALRDALAAAFGSDFNAKKIGKLLHAVQGDDIDGLTIAWVGEDRYGAIWRVCGFPSSKPALEVTPAATRADHGPVNTSAGDRSWKG